MHIYGISVFGKRLSGKSDNVVVFSFAFHIAVQQLFKPLWSRLLLYELKPSRASFALCFKSLLMTLLPASVLVSLFVWRLLFDLSSKGGPASSYANAGIALRVTDILKPPHHDKVETPTTNVYIRKYFSGLVHADTPKLCSSLSTQPCLYTSLKNLLCTKVEILQCSTSLTGSNFKIIILKKET